MTDNALGKGEVESSILSCSTIIPSKIKPTRPKSTKADCAKHRTTESGTVARNWQSPGQGDDARAGYLYRYWSDRGTLLYIGISVNAVARLAQHRGKQWFPRIARIDVERFDTYEEAECAELRAICYEGPIHNIKGPRDAKDLGPALNRLRAAQRRRSANGTPRRHRLRGAYDIDILFGVIPAETSFEEYLRNPKMREDALNGW